VRGGVVGGIDLVRGDEVPVGVAVEVAVDLAEEDVEVAGRQRRLGAVDRAVGGGQ